MKQPAACKNPLEISANGKGYAPFLRRRLIAAHDLLGEKTPLREMSLALVDDRKMSELHERFMGIAGPTDVLTFPLEIAGRGRVISGEVIVNLDEAKRRAREEGVEPKLEVLLYAIHGMLHLCGYDDRTDRGFRAMHRMEDHLLTQLGLGAVFNRKAAAARATRGSRRL